jgi:hypothetical protein
MPYVEKKKPNWYFNKGRRSQCLKTLKLVVTKYQNLSRDVINNVKSKKNFFSSSTQLYVLLNTVACDRKIRSKIKLDLKAFFPSNLMIFIFVESIFLNLKEMVIL